MSEFEYRRRPPSFSGVVPDLSVYAELGPPRSELAVGALMPWAGRLWIVTYVSHKSQSGVGGGLYYISPDLHKTKHPESYTGTYTNRFVHYPSNQLFLGPHVIDSQNNVQTIEALLEVRTCATTAHLHDPEHKVYCLGMEGELFEIDVESLEATQIDDLTETLGVPNHHIAHFKAAYCAFGRLVVVNNSYHEEEFLGTRDAGRLAEWDGERWTVIERNPFVEVTGRGGFSDTMFATGWDRRSAILRVFTAADNTWRRYRLPKASHTFDHAWQTEWPRIRETEHERFLMDCHGMFYELSPWAYGKRVWGVRPISTHLWVHGDFCSWRGMLVIGADNASPSGDHNPLVGEPQSGLWFGKTDDLWRYGKPSGWGGVWWDDEVAAGQPSDPYLMTGFDKKVLHLSHEAGDAVTFTVEVDFLGTGAWKTYETIDVPAGGYRYHCFPEGFSAHWVRVTAGADCTATAYFTYT